MSEENNQSNLPTNSDAGSRPAPARPPRPYRPRTDDGAPAGDNAGGESGAPNQAPAEYSRSAASSAPRRTRRPGGKERFNTRRKVDQFGIDGIREVDYKDYGRLRRYLSERGKIEPRRKSGLSAYHQRSLSTAIKRARYMALLPYVGNNQSR